MQQMPLLSSGYPHIAWPFVVLLVLEWIVWPILRACLPDVLQCPLCKKTFQRSEIDVQGKNEEKRSRRDSFACPKCLRTIGVPNWRAPFLLISYLALIGVFLFILFDLPGELFWGFVAALLAAVGAIQIADWFICRKLEAGSPSEFYRLREP
jgi:hypothetical protein